MGQFAPNTLGEPQTGDYVLGRGVLYISELTASLPGAWRDLGNCTAFNVSQETETLEHASSRAGTKVVDKEVVLQRKFNIAFTLDEINAENAAEWLSGEKATSTNAAVAGFTEYEMIPAVALGRHYDLKNSTGVRAQDIDVTKLTVESRGDTLATVTAAGGRTLTVVAADDTVTASSGSFITDGYAVGRKVLFAGFSASAGANNGVRTITALTATVMTVAEALVDEGPLSSTATIAGSDTPLVEGTDYVLNAKQGILFFPADVAAPKLSEGEGVDVTLTADATAATLRHVRTQTQTTRQVALKFIGVNPADNDKTVEHQIHQCNLKSDGELPLIGDEFMTMSFTGVMESNVVADADSPYMTSTEHAAS